MASRDGAFGILMGAAVGTCSLVLACGPPQAAQSAPCPDVDPASSVLDLLVQSPWEDLIRCAEQGHAEAQFLVGLRYEVGSDDSPRDDAEAVRWYRLVAEQGDADAQFNLGVMYSRGEGVPKDHAEAVRWYRLVAEQGDAAAQLNLGVMYSRGEGVLQDLVLAYMWYDLSAAQGTEAAQRNQEGIERLMTREQIAEAQRLSREWIETHPPDSN